MRFPPLRAATRSNLLTALCWAAAAGFAAWAVVRGFGLERGYPLVPLLAFTPYVALLALPAAALALALGRRLAAAGISVSALVLIALILPRMLPDDPPDPRPTGNGKDLPTVIGSLALPGGEAAEVYSIHPFPPTVGWPSRVSSATSRRSRRPDQAGRRVC